MFIYFVGRCSRLQVLRRIVAAVLATSLRHIVVIGLAIFAWAGPISSAYAQKQWQLNVGEMRVLQFDEVARVAVGDGHVLNAVAAENHEVLVFAKNEGRSSLHIWTADGQQHAFEVQVETPARTDAMHELKSILARIPNINFSQVGSKIIVEGEQLSSHHRQQLLALKQQYSQLLDFTYPIGWESMVLLDVQVVEVPKNAFLDLGVRWADSAQGGMAAGVAWDAGSHKLVDRPGETVVPMPFMPQRAGGYFGVNALMLARLNALSQTGQAVILAQPQLLARSGATAEFLAGGEVPYSAIDAQGNPQTQFKPYGVSLKITPHIEQDGAVRSFLDIEVSTIDNSVSTPAGPALKSRRASTEFNIQSGQTLVLAGFISREISEQQDAVPGLANLPIIGALFKSRRFINNETELAFFVTPTLIDAEHPMVEQRVARAAQITEQYFPRPNTLNVNAPPAVLQQRLHTDQQNAQQTGADTTVATLSSAHQNTAQPGTAALSSGRWNPYQGSGTQWQSSASTPTTQIEAFNVR